VPPVLARDDAPAGEHGTSAAPRPAQRWVRPVLVVVVAAMVAMWGYVLYLAVGPGRPVPADRVEDPAFAPAAEQRCAAALAEVGALPRANETPDPVERADVLDRANAVFARMLDDLERLRPAGDDGRIVGLWLDDWRTYLGDRQAYAARLRVDPDARLLVTADARAGGRHITLLIDDFAVDNRIPACATPLDA
jgi:hypothetical protein